MDMGTKGGLPRMAAGKWVFRWGMHANRLDTKEGCLNGDRGTIELVCRGSSLKSMSAGWYDALVWGKVGSLGPFGG